MNKNLQPELKDMVDSINRFLATNKKKDVCLAGIIAVFDEEGELIEEKNMAWAYGEKESVRDALNALRDKVEDDSDGDFVDM